MLFMPKINPNKHIHSLEESDIHISGDEATQELLKLCQLTEKDLNALAKIDDIMEEHASTIADRHYDMIMMIPEIKDIFNNFTSYKAYTTIITEYYKQLTKPVINADYIAYRKKIGDIHSRIHLTGEWYIGSYVRVYEYLFPLIISRFHSKPTILTDILTALNRIITFDSLVVLTSYQEANDLYLVENINKVMESVMGADKVGELLTDVASTVKETFSISEAATELSDSVQQVAENATSVSGNTVKMIEESKKGHDLIETSLNGFLKMAEDFNQMKEKLTHLIGDVHEITNVVELIENVAEETNLLALNASIEAARAGDSGRGFSVVASEVRSLAEQTKTSVKQISRTIHGIQLESTEVGDTVQAMSNTLSVRVEQTNNSIEVMKEIMQQIKTVGDATEDIAAIAEEQSAATEGITNRIITIHDHTEKIKEESATTGKSIYDVSMEVDALRKEVMSAIPELTSGQLLRASQTEHQLLGWWLYNKQLGYDDGNSNVQIECGLGVWIEKMHQENTRITALPSFKALEQPHRDFHSKIDAIHKLIDRGDKDEAKKQMVVFETLSNTVLWELENLQKAYTEL